MPWKVVNNEDGGSETIWGGDDWDKFSKLFNGDLDVDDVYVNSPFEFKDEKLLIRNQADTASAKVRVGAITTDVEYSFPQHDVNSEIVLDSAPQVLTNKTIDASLNNLVGFGASGAASPRKSGLLQSPMTALGGTVGQGLLAGHIDMGNISNAVGAPPLGTYWKYETGAEGFTNTGLRYNATFLRADFNPRLKVKYKVPLSTAGHQILIGFSSDTDIVGTQEPLEETHSGFLVGYADVHTSYSVITNSGTNAQPSSPSYESITEVLKSSTLIRTIEIEFKNQGTEALVTISNIDPTPPYSATTELVRSYFNNLPALTEQGTGAGIYLRPVIQLTNQEDVNHEFDLCFAELASDF